MPIPESTKWYTHAACKNMDLTTFFLASEEAKALVICSNCRVMQECRISCDTEEGRYSQYAYGVRGGETADERKQRRRSRARKAS